MISLVLVLGLGLGLLRLPLTANCNSSVVMALYKHDRHCVETVLFGLTRQGGLIILIILLLLLVLLEAAPRLREFCFNIDSILISSITSRNMLLVMTVILEA